MGFHWRAAGAPERSQAGGGRQELCREGVSWTKAWVKQESVMSTETRRLVDKLWWGSELGGRSQGGF